MGILRGSTFAIMAKGSGVSGSCFDACLGTDWNWGPTFAVWYLCVSLRVRSAGGGACWPGCGEGLGLRLLGWGNAEDYSKPVCTSVTPG